MTRMSETVIAVIATMLVASVSATPHPLPVGITSKSAMLTWLATTDAEINFIGTPPKRHLMRGASSDTADANVMVTYCSVRDGTTCTSPCTVYNGGPTCLCAPSTTCLSATANVFYCESEECSGSCLSLAECDTPLDNSFCYTPGTGSINVPAAS